MEKIEPHKGSKTIGYIGLTRILLYVYIFPLKFKKW